MNTLDNNEFYTFSEYMKKENKLLTASMQDYMEMIYRLSKKNGFTRINELSQALNVQPPSATSMVQRLADLKLLNYEKYGVITLEDSGKKLGDYLLKRHNTIEAFLKRIGVPKNCIFDDTEKIEHTISNETLKCFSDFTSFLNQYPNVIEDFLKFCSKKKVNP